MKSKTSFSLMLFIFFLSIGCSKPYIRIEPNEEVTLPGTPSSETVVIVSNCEWVASSSSQWIILEPANGIKGSTPVRISVNQNDPFCGVRAGVVYFTSDGVVSQLIVNQSQFNDIEVEQLVDIEPIEGAFEIWSKSNVVVSVSIEESAKDWLSLLSSRTVNYNSFVFSAKANQSLNDRLGVIHFCGDGVDKKTTIHQKGVYITPENEQVSISPKGGTVSIPIISGCSWTASSDQSWSRLQNNNGSAGRTNLHVIISENGTVDVRNANIMLRSVEYNIIKSITIKQDPYDWYVDNNGVNRGKGVEIDGKVWAPVNCGFEPTTAPRGRYYQWGRKHGQIGGYAGQGFSAADLWTGENGEEDPNTVYCYTKDDLNSPANYSRDWIVNGDNHFWNTGSEDNPVKTVFDPCPKGWRVPSYKELSELCKNRYYESGEGGVWVSGSKSYSSDLQEKLFLPSAGARWTYGNNFSISFSGLWGAYWTSEAFDNGGVGHVVLISTTYSFTRPDIGRANSCTIRCIHE